MSGFVITLAALLATQGVGPQFDLICERASGEPAEVATVRLSMDTAARRFCLRSTDGSDCYTQIDTFRVEPERYVMTFFNGEIDGVIERTSGRFTMSSDGPYGSRTVRICEPAEYTPLPEVRF